METTTTLPVALESNSRPHQSSSASPPSSASSPSDRDMNGTPSAIAGSDATLSGNSPQTTSAVVPLSEDTIPSTSRRAEIPAGADSSTAPAGTSPSSSSPPPSESVPGSVVTDESARSPLTPVESGLQETRDLDARPQRSTDYELHQATASAPVGHPTSDASTDAVVTEVADSAEVVGATPPASNSRLSRRAVRFRVHNRPAQLIRNLHASYLTHLHQEQQAALQKNSAVATVIRSFRCKIFAAGAFLSMAGCAVMVGTTCGLAPGSSLMVTVENCLPTGILARVSYHGFFAAVCSWQWVKRAAISASILAKTKALSSKQDANTTSHRNDDSDPQHPTLEEYPSTTQDHGPSPPAATAMGERSSVDSDSGRFSSEGDTADDQEACAAEAAPHSTTSTAHPGWTNSFCFASTSTLSYMILGYGLLGLIWLTPMMVSHGLGSLPWNNILAISSVSPILVGSALVGLDKISNALSQDMGRHVKEKEALQEQHEDMLEMYRNENLYRKNVLLETVGKEVQDATSLAIEMLQQMTPTSLFLPSVSREQLSPCTLPIPITSILGLFTTMRHLQYISRNMQRLSRVMFTEYVQGIVEKTSPHYHRGDSGFDVGEFVQSLGDLVSADASLKGVEFVLYHAEYDLKHVSIKGSEESWRHALINLIKSIIDCAQHGSTLELCLGVYDIPGHVRRHRLMVSFEIVYYPNPNSNPDEDDLAQMNFRLASKLIMAMGGSLTIETLTGNVKKFIVSVEVEMSQPIHEERSTLPKVQEEPLRTVHPFDIPRAEDRMRSASATDLHRLENMSTAHPVHDSQQFFNHHLKTPLVSPLPPMASPPLRYGCTKVSSEPTIHDLIRFSRKLKDIKVLLIARESSTFAVRLAEYLKVWGVIVLKRAIRDSPPTPATTPSGSTIGDLNPTPTEEPRTPTTGAAKRTSSSSSLSSKHSARSDSTSSMSTSKSLNNPAFIMIDDDVKVLGEQILKLQANPTSPAATAPPKRPTHRRHKSVTSVQHTSIIYFTSLPTFKQARDMIMTILGVNGPTLNYNITSNMVGGPTAQGHLPYILVLPKPAGPRRVLTAIHTAINLPILDQNYFPIATAPTSPAPVVRHFSEEINPLDRDQIVYDPVSNHAFARSTPQSTQSSPGGLSPNQLPVDSRGGRDIVRQLIDAGKVLTTAGVISGGGAGATTTPSAASANASAALTSYPFDQTPAATPADSTMSPVTMTDASLQQLVGSPTGVVVPATATQPQGIQFDPTARPSGALSPSLSTPGHRRISNGSGGSSGSMGLLGARHQSHSSVGHDSSGMVFMPHGGTSHSPSSFMLVSSYRNSVSGGVDSPSATPAPTSAAGTVTGATRSMSATSSLSSATTMNGGIIRLNNGQLLRPAANNGTVGRSPLATPSTAAQLSNGPMFSPPIGRHHGMASPMPQRPEPAAMRNGSMSSINGANVAGGKVDSPKMAHPVLPHGAIQNAASPLSNSPGNLQRVSPGAGIGNGENVNGSGALVPNTVTAPVANNTPPPAQNASTSSTSAPVSSALSSRKNKGGVGKVPMSMVKSGVAERVIPRVNVLIVEDNHINLAIMVKFMQQRKIRYAVAHDGKQAVEKWKLGGIHLVLMDLQMPIMDGIEATREIRRMEREQKIGIFPGEKTSSSSTSSNSLTSLEEASSALTLPVNGEQALPSPSSPFRSPVIIVALTASAADEESRQTALLAGCNDYITKPIDLYWLERKILDWGCMQALIDVEAWRDWKEIGEETSKPPGSGWLIGSDPSSGSLGGESGKRSRGGLLVNKRPSISVRSIKGNKAGGSLRKEHSSASLASTATTSSTSSTKSSGSLDGSDATEMTKAVGKEAAPPSSVAKPSPLAQTQSAV